MLPDDEERPPPQPTATRPDLRVDAERLTLLDMTELVAAALLPTRRRAEWRVKAQAVIDNMPGDPDAQEQAYRVVQLLDVLDMTQAALHGLRVQYQQARAQLRGFTTLLGAVAARGER